MNKKAWLLKMATTVYETEISVSDIGLIIVVVYFALCYRLVSLLKLQASLHKFTTSGLKDT